MTEYKPKKMDHHNQPSVLPIDQKSGNLANREEEHENQAIDLSWITKESLIKQYKIAAPLSSNENSSHEILQKRVSVARQARVQVQVSSAA
jgi:hypothetical protein